MHDFRRATPPRAGTEDSRLRNVAYNLIDSSAAQRCSSDTESDSEDKFYTVEEAVEKLGFGKFQLRILLITGVMTAADAMEMLLLSVLGPALRCDWRLNSAQVALITTVVFAGMLIGAPSWGAVSDKRGRWSVFALSLSLIAYFGMLCSFSPNYFWLIALRGLVGFNISGAASSFTLLSEYLPQKYRAKVLILYNLFWGVGSTFEIVLAYLVLPTLGWRYLVAFSALPLVLTLPTLSCLPESARYLLASGQAEEAALVIDQIARENGRPLMKCRPAMLSEVYPTVVRSIGLGLCSSMARFGSMSAPFVAQVILPDVSLLLGFSAFAAVGVCCAGLSLMLPIETRGRAMPQSLNLKDVIDKDCSQVLGYSTSPDGSRATVEIRLQRQSNKRGSHVASM